MNPETQTSPSPSQLSGDFPVTAWLEVTDRKKVVNQYWTALKAYLGALLARFPEYRGEADSGGPGKESGKGAGGR